MTARVDVAVNLTHSDDMPKKRTSAVASKPKLGRPRTTPVPVSGRVKFVRLDSLEETVAIIVDRLGGKPEVARSAGLTVAQLDSFAAGTYEVDESTRRKLHRLAHEAKVGWPMGRPRFQFTGPLAELVEKVGGPKFLAEEIGVSVRALQRYEREESTPPGPVVKILNMLAESHGLNAPF